MFWLLYQIIKSGAGAVSGDGSAIGDAIASATGASLADADGAATGDAVAGAVGASVAAADGSAVGDAIASGQIQDATPVVVVTPTVTPTLGVGSAAWRNWYRSKLPKKKKKKLDELEEMIAELQARVVPVSAEVAGFDDGAYERTLRISQEFAERSYREQIAAEDIQRQINLLKSAVEEMDDEEAIILALS